MNALQISSAPRKFRRQLVTNAVLASTIALTLSASATADTEQRVGKWHLLTTTTSFSTIGQDVSPRPSQAFPDRDAGHPNTSTSTYEDKINKIAMESGATPWDCNTADAPIATHACDFVDNVSVLQPNIHRIDFSITNHGGRGGIRFHVLQYQPIVTKQESPESDWIVGRSFIIEVPTATSATVIGTFRNSAVFFTPTAPLSAEDAKRFKLVETKRIPNDTDPIETLYRFQVLDPGP